MSASHRSLRHTMPLPNRNPRSRRAGMLATLLFALLGLAPPGTAATVDDDTPLAQIEHIAASGGPGLALALLDRRQPAVEDDLAGWFEYERGRLGILSRWQEWDKARQRLRAVHDQLPTKLQRWALGQRAWLWLEEQRADAALAELRGLIWRHGARAEAAELALWRRLVIRAYLIGDRIDDARIALRRYRQDYPGQSAEWAQLRAEVWLRSGLAARVLALSAAERDALPGALLLLARLRAGDLSPDEVWIAASERARNPANSRALRADYWRVAAQAARARDSAGFAAHATEQALLLAGARHGGDALPAVDAAALWRVWREYGEQAANRAQLLSGDEAGWLAAVETAAEKNTPVKARALLVLLAEQDVEAASRERALTQLADRLAAIQPVGGAADGAGGDATVAGTDLLLLMFLDETRFATLDELPVALRQRLVDEALGREDIALASRLLASLERLPEGVDAFAWRLRRARVLVIGGQIEAGVAALETLLDEQPQLDAEQIDRLLQVVFDLQAVESHEAAIALMQRLQSRLVTPRQHRELHFWQADSLAALGRHSEAAWRYLRSATLLETGGRDQWGQSARYRAAETLAEAGLVGDARRLYQTLLDETDKPERRTVLRQRIQQLLLAPRAAGDVGGDAAQD